jgi:hypothetical protein
LAYWGFGLGDSAVDKRIGDWADGMLSRREHEFAGGPPSPSRIWAEVLVERYDGVPVQEQWQNDPIVARLRPELAASLRDEVLSFAVEEWDKNPRRLRAMTEAQVVALTKARLDSIEISYDGNHPIESWDALFPLARARSAVVLPVIESRIEEVLLSATSPALLSGRAQRVLGACGRAIAAAADEQALRLAAKYGRLEPLSTVFGRILHETSDRGNPFRLIYRALEAPSLLLDGSVARWTEDALRSPALNIPKDRRRQWAEAMVERYGAAPTAAQWSKDPIASRLKPEVAESLHSEVARLSVEVVRKRVGN